MNVNSIQNVEIADSVQNNEKSYDDDKNEEIELITKNRLNKVARVIPPLANPY